MLTLQMGLNRDTRRGHLMAKIAKARMEGFRRVYVLVSEQSTFIMDREVCRILGNTQRGCRVEVLGFERLMQHIYEECGEATEHLDEGGRLLAMALASEKAGKSKELTVYRHMTGRPEFLSSLLSTYTTFRLHGITPGKLEMAADEVETPVLKNKLHDLAKLFNAYNEICEKSKLDPADRMERVTHIMAEKQWASGTAWFIDGFTDFPKQQMSLVQTIICQADYVMVSLAAAGLHDTMPSHKISIGTGEKLNQFAWDNDIPCEVIRTTDKSSEHKALAYIQTHMCDDAPAAEAHISDASNVVKLFCDPSPYHECQHIAGTILRAIRKGYRYRDISIVLCDFKRYAPILETVCHRYGIPAYFASQKDEISKKPIMLSVFSALDSATHGMQKEDVLQYLKSGLSTLSPDEVDILENYVRTWNIHGRGWEPEGGWTMHPGGYGLEFSSDDTAALAAINEFRARAIDPLLALRDDLSTGKTVSEHVTALYAFLEKNGFTEHLQSVVNELLATDQEQMAMEYAQVSEVLNNALEQMYAVIGGVEKRSADFTKLFRLLCSAYKIATIPVSVDQVEVACIEDARYACNKLRYIVGAEEGVFPAYIQGGGLLLESNEIDAIKQLNMDMDLPGSVEDLALRGLTDIDTVVSGAKRMLVLSYSSEPTAPTTPSHLLLRVQQMFPGVEPVRGAGEDNIYEADLLSSEMAGRLLGRLQNRPGYENIVWDMSCIDNHIMQETAFRVMTKNDWALNGLSKESIKGLYGERINLTATRVDTYSSCRYHYFLRYGLGIREPASGQFNSPVFGRFAHQVLEGAIREIETERGGFQSVTTTELEDITRKHIDRYTAEKMKGLDSQPERYIYLYKRNCREVLNVMRNICEEFQASDFHCSAFELKMGGEHADLPAITIPGTEMTGIYTGVADRVDTAVVNNKPYFRVVDYKTGKAKVFDMSDILCGLSMQLLMYQASLRKDGYAVGAESAGILYVPAKTAIVATPTKVDAKKVESERQKMLQRRGILLDEKEVLNAMEHPEEGETKFLPVKFASDGKVTGDVCSAEQLSMLDDFTAITMSGVVDDIASGAVKANPISRRPDQTACTWCPMKAACHKDSCGIKFRYRAKVKHEEFWATIEDKVKAAK